MKILILTQPLHTNYGGLLQAYALQQILKGMGHDVVTDRLGVVQNCLCGIELYVFISCYSILYSKELSLLSISLFIRFI